MACIMWQVRDLGVVLADARFGAFSLLGVSATQQLYLASMAQGHGSLSALGVALVLEQLNGGLRLGASGQAANEWCWECAVGNLHVQ